jgi:tetratricopeptide (TPR) repeat protein
LFQNKGPVKLLHNQPEMAILFINKTIQIGEINTASLGHATHGTAHLYSSLDYEEVEMSFIPGVFRGVKEKPPQMTREQAYRVYLDFIRTKNNKTTEKAVFEQVTSHTQPDKAAHAVESAKRNGVYEKLQIEFALKFVMDHNGLSKNQALKIIQECNHEYLAMQTRAKSGDSEVLNYYDEILHINPQFDDGWVGKGNLLNLLQKYEEALDCYETAMKTNPDNECARRNSIWGWYEKGNRLMDTDNAEAIRCYNRVLDLSPTHHQALRNKGLALYHQNQLEEAVVYFNKALKVVPVDVPVWCNEAFALTLLGRSEEALYCCDKALDVDPLDHTATDAKAWVESRIQAP